jgi:hypothetical protein
MRKATFLFTAKQIQAGSDRHGDHMYSLPNPVGQRKTEKFRFLTLLGHSPRHFEPNCCGYARPFAGESPLERLASSVRHSDSSALHGRRPAQCVFIAFPTEGQEQLFPSHCPGAFTSSPGRVNERDAIRSDYAESVFE